MEVLYEVSLIIIKIFCLIALFGNIQFMKDDDLKTIANILWFILLSFAMKL